MASALVHDLLNAGIHFGAHASRWNPKMKPYIHGKRNALHIIDVRETLRGLLRARKFLTMLVSGGQDVLFVGTKRQARDAVATQSARCQMHYVNERWLGGTLTNFRTIRSRLQRLEELEALVAGPRWETDFSKKMKSMLTRELKKIRRNLDGVRKMTRLPGALVVIDVRKEHNAVREAQALGIPTIGLVDTDSDPDKVSIAIPGNDDAMRVIELVVTQLADAIEEGRRARPEPTADPGEGRGEPGGREHRERGGRGRGGRRHDADASEAPAVREMPAPPADRAAPSEFVAPAQ